MKMKKVIIDTNALMSINELNLDIFDELEDCCDFPYELFILEGTMDELYKIMDKQKGKFREAAKLALQLVEAKEISIIPERGYVDDLLVEHSKQGDIVLTQDKALKKRLKKPYLVIRQKKLIVLIE